MRITAALVVSLLALCGCGRTRPETVALEPLARALQEEWPASTRDVRMTISVKQVTDHEVLHCRLENTSANAIELDSSALPWRTPALFQFRTVTAQGKVLPRYPPIVIQMVDPSQFVSVASGAILEGDVDLAYVPIHELPRNEDLLLLWSHGLSIARGAQHAVLSGVTLMPKRPH
jgi:hypothetical protein